MTTEAQIITTSGLQTEEGAQDLHAIPVILARTIRPGRSQQSCDKIKPLAQQPELGRSGRPGLPDDVRELVVHRNYTIFYRVLSDARIVEILRVKHAAQQAP
jgi:plasmid stabilization system protein ParE